MLDLLTDVRRPRALGLKAKLGAQPLSGAQRLGPKVARQGAGQARPYM